MSAATSKTVSKGMEASAPNSTLPEPTDTMRKELQAERLQLLQARVAQLEDEAISKEENARDKVAQLQLCVSKLEKEENTEVVRLQAKLHLQVESNASLVHEKTLLQQKLQVLQLQGESKLQEENIALKDQVAELQLVLSEMRRRSRSRTRDHEDRGAKNDGGLGGREERGRGELGAPYRVVSSIDTVGKRTGQPPSFEAAHKDAVESMPSSISSSGVPGTLPTKDEEIVELTKHIAQLVVARSEQDLEARQVQILF